MALQRAVYAVIGDLVASRKSVSRSKVQARLVDVLREVSAEVDCVQPFGATVGDEFQGVFPDIGTVARATLLVRLEMIRYVDVRFGIGFGDLELLDATARPAIQDGSAWWSAREAIDLLGAKSRRDQRACFVSHPSAFEVERTLGLPVVAAQPDLVNAFLIVRDKLVDRLGDRGREMLIGALGSRTQGDIAEEFGLTQGAVSQQFTRGVAAVRDAQRLLENLT